MSTEERIIRPFFGVDKLQSAFGGMRLAVGDEIVDPDSSHELLPHEFLNSKVSLLLAADDHELSLIRVALLEGIAELGIAADGVDLLVQTTSPKLKFTDQVARFSIESLDPTKVRLSLVTKNGGRPRALSTPVGGCTIDVYLVLAQSIEPVALKAWRKGTWLAKTRFRLRTDTGDAGFLPIAMDDSVRDRLGIEKNVIRFVVLEESSLDPSVGTDALSLYVDDELLAVLATNPKTAAGKTFQRQLFIDAVSAIVLDAARRPELTESDMGGIEDSLLGRLIVQCAGRKTGESESVRRNRQNEYLALVKDEPAKFLALFEHKANLKSDLKAVLAGGVA